jgi:hypothetical protein
MGLDEEVYLLPEGLFESILAALAPGTSDQAV